MLKNSSAYMSFQLRHPGSYDSTLPSTARELITRGSIMQVKSPLLIVLGLYTSAPAQAGGVKSFVGHLSQRLLSFAVGTAVGIPIALARCTKRELVKQTKEAYSLGGVLKPRQADVLECMHSKKNLHTHIIEGI